MAAKAKLTTEQRQVIAKVLAARQALPSDKELARQFGVSVWAIRWNMTQILQTIAVSRGSKAGKVRACHALEPLLTNSANASLP